VNLRELIEQRLDDMDQALDGYGVPENLLVVLGADPGPTTGLILAAWDTDRLVLVECLALECTGAMAPKLLDVLLRTPYGVMARRAGGEAFVTRARSQSLRGASASGMATIIGELSSVAEAHGLTMALRSAGLVKPWATDKRLAAAGLIEPTEKFTDSRDAARHMLFCAVHDCGLPVPGGQEWRAAREAAKGGPRDAMRDRPG
jgi:hypothetical protein